VPLAKRAVEDGLKRCVLASLDLMQGGGNKGVMSARAKGFTVSLVLLMFLARCLWRVYFPLAGVVAVEGELLTCHFMPLCSQP